MMIINDADDNGGSLMMVVMVLVAMIMILEWNVSVQLEIKRPNETNESVRVKVNYQLQLFAKKHEKKN